MIKKAQNTLKTENEYKLYVRDAIFILKEQLEKAAKAEKEGKLDATSEVLVLFDVLDTLKSEAEVFKLPLDELGLDENFYKYLMNN